MHPLDPERKRERDTYYGEKGTHIMSVEAQIKGAKV